MTDYRQLLACSDAELARVDPLVMNLLVAKSIPSLADLDIPRYRWLADQWAEEVRRRLPAAEQAFWQTPQDWKNDVNFFRLGVLCGYLEYEAGIAYNEDQRDVTAILYTNPSDPFERLAYPTGVAHLARPVLPFLPAVQTKALLGSILLASTVCPTLPGLFNRRRPNRPDS